MTVRLLRSVWWLPPTLLLPSEVAKNVHFKLGVNGSLATGKARCHERKTRSFSVCCTCIYALNCMALYAAQVELLTARLTNLPPLLASPLRTAVGVALGALPHALEGVLGYVFDAADGADYYAREREAAFDARHPGVCCSIFLSSDASSSLLFAKSTCLH